MANLAAADRVCEVAGELAESFKNNFADGLTEGRLTEISGRVVTAVGIRAVSRFPGSEVQFNSL